MPTVPWDAAEIKLMGGRPVQIPDDAHDMHDLNEELFNDGDESEMSYGGALNNNHLGNGGFQDPEEAADIEYVEQENA